jgi:glycine oxidase
MLAPSAEAESPSPLFSLARWSRQLYPPLVQELINETGIDPCYRSEGTLLPFASSTERDHLRQAFIWQADEGVGVKELAQSDLREAEPCLDLSNDVGFQGAFFLPDDHQVDNRLLVQALVSSCRRRGVEFLLGEPVLSIVSERGTATGVLIGPEKSPRAISAGTIVNASGAWAAQIAGQGIPALPLRPVKGHMLALRTSPDTLRHVVRTPQVYLIPRRDGRIIVGSTMEEAGFDKTVHAAPVATLLDAALRTCPALAKAEWVDAWAGLRPATPDSLPILGPVPGLMNYWAALGHFRNGILLAPATARALGDWLIHGQPSADLSAFSPARFLGVAAGH